MEKCGARATGWPPRPHDNAVKQLISQYQAIETFAHMAHTPCTHDLPLTQTGLAGSRFQDADVRSEGRRAGPHLRCQRADGHERARTMGHAGLIVSRPAATGYRISLYSEFK